jgi:ribosomal protein L23
MNKHSGQILITPRITEKAANLSAEGCYVFMVAPDAGKRAVAEAVRSIYKVTPRKVTLVALPRKRVVARGRGKAGTTAGGKKAYVFLKKGDTIELA